MELWFCLDCNQPRPLNEHLRCAVCDSDSVAFNQSLHPLRRWERAWKGMESCLGKNAAKGTYRLHGSRHRAIA